MRKSKLIKYLSTFTENEARQLGLFVSTQLFIKSKRPFKVQALLQFLLLHHPQYSPADVDEAKAYQAVFPKEKFNKAKLSQVATDCMDMIYQFINIFFVTPDTEFNNCMTRIQFYQKRGMDNEFLNAVDKAQNNLEENPYKNAWHFHRHFLLEVERLKQLQQYNDKKGDADLPNTIRYLDLYYIASKMEFCSYLLTRSISAKVELDESMLLMAPVLKAAKEHFLDVPLISVYYYTYSLILHPNEEGKDNFQRLKQVLTEHATDIPPDSFKTIHTCMRNYLSNRYINGEASCLNDLFELIKEQTLHGTIYPDGHHIWASTLQNAITVALKLNEHEWAMDFLMQHENRIKGSDDEEAMYRFNLANIYFHQGKYHAAQDCLDKTHFREMFYNLAARRLDMKLCLETNMPLPVLESRQKAMKIFVYSQKTLLPDDKFDSNNNFVKVLLQYLTILKDRADTYSSKNKDLSRQADRLLKLIERVEQEKTIAEREWLLEKLQALLPENQK